MCGKFTQDRSWSELHALMRALDPEEIRKAAERQAAGADDDAGDRVDVATPMRMARIVALDENGERQLVLMRWGFIAPWEPGKLVIHARCETIDRLATFKDAFAKRRGILVCRTFNEGQEIGSKTKQFVITPRDGLPISIAVIWQPATLPNGQPILTFAMATTPPNELISTITDRMPAVLKPDDWSKWLGEEPATPEELKAMLMPFEGDWDMPPQDPPRPPRPGGRGRRDRPSQRDLFS